MHTGILDGRAALDVVKFAIADTNSEPPRDTKTEKKRFGHWWRHGPPEGRRRKCFSPFREFGRAERCGPSADLRRSASPTRAACCSICSIAGTRHGRLLEGAAAFCGEEASSG